MSLPHSHSILAHLFSLSGAVLAGLALGSFFFVKELQPYAAMFLLAALLLYVWSSHFWARQRYATIERQLATLQTRLDAQPGHSL